MKKCHGSLHVVQYLKGCHLAIQKFIAGSPVSSLKELLGPGVYPRLCNGLPKFIPLGDRSLIRNQNTSVIRYYLTLFSIYRVIDCKRTLKLSTITDPYSGSEVFMEDFINISNPILEKFFKKPILKAFKPLEEFS
jgi:hypothetical protein